MLLKALLAFSTIFAFATGYLLSYIWLIQLTLWLVLGCVIYAFASRENAKYKNSILLLISSYLILESLLKILIGYTNNTWLVINSLEHFIWSFAFASLLFYPINNYLKGKSQISIIIILISLVCTIGIFNELIEYIPRSENLSLGFAYYSDTIRDLFLNFIGSAISAILISFLRLRVTK